jgi:hypothetical protein
MKRCLPVLFTLGLLPLLAACPEKEKPSTDKPVSPSAASTAAATGTGSGVPTAAVTAAPTGSEHATPARPQPCEVEREINLASGVRLDTGITITELSDLQDAIGYASGDGSPQVAVIDTQSGAVTRPPVDQSHVKDQEAKKDPKMVRTLWRVTPIGMNADKMRVAMDFVDATPKNEQRYLRCGPADAEPIVTDNSNLTFFDPTEDDVAKVAMKDKTDLNTFDTRDCRTFVDGKTVFVLATNVHRDAPDNHNVAVDWYIEEAKHDGPPKAIIDRRVIKPSKDKKYPGLGSYFQSPVGKRLDDGSILLLARVQGSLVFAKRTDKLEKSGEPSMFWLGAAADMPALHAHDDKASVVVTLRDHNLYAASFPAKGDKWKPVKPTKVEDLGIAADGSSSVSDTEENDLAVAFASGDTKRTAHFTVLGPDGKRKLSSYQDVSPEGVNVQEVRVVALSKKRALVSYLDTSGKLAASVLRCKY